MSKLSKVAAGLAAVPMLAFAAPAIADSPGQLEGGAIVYQVKNATQNGSYGSAATATACNDELKYSVRLHNTEFGKITSITVKATLPATSPSASNMTASGTNSAGATVSTNGTVTVTMGANQSLAYEAGSTQLFDGNAQLISNLPDGITNNGVNAGDLNGSTTEFVTFKAKVSCPTTPPTTPPTQPKPTTLVNTGAGSVAGLFAVVAAAGAFGYRLFIGRRLSRQ